VLAVSYDITAEVSAAACALVLPESVNLMNLSSEDFTDRRLGRLYGACAEAVKRGDIPDVIGIARETGESMASVSGVVDDGLTANPESYARHIRAGKVRRQASEIAHRISSGGDPAQEVPVLLAMLQPSRGEVVSLRNALRNALASIESDAPRGAPWGFSRLDSRIGPMGNGHLIVIGARPAMGKTAFALNLAMNQPGRTLFISGEQPAEEIALRAMTMRSGVSGDVIRSRTYADDVPPRLAAAAAEMRDKRLEIADFDAPTLGDVFAVARREHFREPLSLIVVDYLQRLKVPGRGARSYEVGDNAQALKTLARQLEVPVVVLAQVNREVESRTDKRPHMGDLKDSGIIEQEADLIALLYRDGVYNEDSPDRDICEVLIDKNRHGPTGMVRLRFDSACMRFDDIETRDSAY
jgi:replicative DNA helicase